MIEPFIPQPGDLFTFRMDGPDPPLYLVIRADAKGTVIQNTRNGLFNFNAPRTTAREQWGHITLVCRPVDGGQA